MLRSQGIPSRMAAGYAPGTFDTTSQSYVVRESSAHTWPEVYFPKYGWIEFEPTPSQRASEQGLLPTTADTEPTPVPSVQASPTIDEKLPRGTPKPAATGQASGGGPASGAV